MSGSESGGGGSSNPWFSGLKPQNAADINQFKMSAASQGLSQHQLDLLNFDGQNFDAHGAAAGGAAAFNAPNQDEYNAVLTKFNEWKNANAATTAAHDQYVSLTQSAPGRSATILTQPGPNKPTTLIGG